MSELKLQGLGKNYGNRQALADLTLTLKKGEITGILGANGAGKSTLLKILAGYFFPSAGTVRLGKLDLQDSPGEWRRICGYLPEGAPLPSRKSACELLREGYRLYRDDLPEEEVLASFMERYGLDGEMGQKPVKALSRGYRQRTGLALAEIGEPALLLLDEPFSGLDPTLVRQLRTNLKEGRKGRITLFSSHILQEIHALCDTIVILHEGTLRATVKKSDFSSWEELDDLYSSLTGEASHE
ncbi:MAG: ABC transporter ATP-binding protein [Spirochaetales bacterium]|nr:ABC transporter ATP-binding protein [Spirochaetales bacterium]